MTIKLAAKAGLAAVSCLALSACSSDNTYVTLGVKTAKSVLSKDKPEPPVVTPEQLNAVLTTSDRASSVFVIENTTAQFILVEVQKSGPYQTFGSSSRQAVVLRTGKMVSTRGFGGDLMSSDEGALLSLVRSRSTGNATYVQRFLTPDNRTKTNQYDCVVEPGETVSVVSGEVNRKARAITASCSNEAVSFKNIYVVDSAGNVLSTRQWMGDTLGYINAQAIRL